MAFYEATSFVLSNLTSIQSINMGSKCFRLAPSFSLTGLIDGLVWTHRSSSTTITQTWWCCILLCSVGCVWEWLNGWIDYSDLPKLQSIQLATGALRGDSRDDRKTISDEPYNYKNTLIMRSEIEWIDEWTDLPSLTEFKGDGSNFWAIGSVALESSYLSTNWCRYPSIVIRWNSIRWWLLLLHLFRSVNK